ncbi:hypothetical protein CW736_00285 [Nonlabens sp. MB-3u-79]|jgi:hypothetical protein|uniref:hypothetical protein n=1 Tax=Nonlabens sp. MB-3u-79 TaxID=2058134 RepID=UPI000C31013C|nr:hypothetical protein [Nonlabens sp. MB-3u-79]AUC77939.1 hypothetical protein CW736_00285 [Nonlabens sp. MB-3u-79]|tara:strand:+ start:14727 stop:15026 length:300 start_codon:yes stop_codon:yes gene_type:complete
MALEIKNIEGVIYLSGTASSSHIPEVLNFFKSLLETDKNVMVNLCDVKSGQDSLLQELKRLKNNLSDDYRFVFYRGTSNDVIPLYKEINNPLNFYSMVA